MCLQVTPTSSPLHSPVWQPHGPCQVSCASSGPLPSQMPRLAPGMQSPSRQPGLLLELLSPRPTRQSRQPWASLTSITPPPLQPPPQRNPMLPTQLPQQVKMPVDVTINAILCISTAGRSLEGLSSCRGKVVSVCRFNRFRASRAGALNAFGQLCRNLNAIRPVGVLSILVADDNSLHSQNSFCSLHVCVCAYLRWAVSLSMWRWKPGQCPCQYSICSST